MSADRTAEKDGPCPYDGQSIAWHQHVAGTDGAGMPRTNGEFIGCDFGRATPAGQ
jgi:hypothetical protein